MFEIQNRISAQYKTKHYRECSLKCNIHLAKNPALEYTEITAFRIYIEFIMLTKKWQASAAYIQMGDNLNVSSI